MSNLGPQNLSQQIDTMIQLMSVYVASNLNDDKSDEVIDDFEDLIDALNKEIKKNDFLINQNIVHLNRLMDSYRTLSKDSAGLKNYSDATFLRSERLAEIHQLLKKIKKVLPKVSSNINSAPTIATPPIENVVISSAQNIATPINDKEEVWEDISLDDPVPKTPKFIPRETITPSKPIVNSNFATLLATPDVSSSPTIQNINEVSNRTKGIQAAILIGVGLTLAIAITLILVGSGFTLLPAVGIAIGAGLLGAGLFSNTGLLPYALKSIQSSPDTESSAFKAPAANRQEPKSMPPVPNIKSENTSDKILSDSILPPSKSYRPSSMTDLTKSSPPTIPTSAPKPQKIIKLIIIEEMVSDSCKNNQLNKMNLYSLNLSYKISFIF